MSKRDKLLQKLRNKAADCSMQDVESLFPQDVENKAIDEDEDDTEDN